jgi:hypothetical protein
MSCCEYARLSSEISTIKVEPIFLAADYSKDVDYPCFAVRICVGKEKG